MSEIYIVSDTHFGHSNFLTFKNADGSLVRKFSCVEEMDECMVNNWNRVISPEDIVYHLGDVYFGDGHKHLSRLKGRKRLILGNHDNGKASYIQCNFQKVVMWRMFPEFNCLLTHVPVHESTLFKVKYNLHGHIHQQPSPSPLHINCSVEVQDYTPKHISTLVPNG